MDVQSQNLLDRLGNCDINELHLVHQEIYDLSEEELKHLSLELFPVLFSNLLRDSALTSLPTLEYVAAISSPKESVIALLEISCLREDNFNFIVFLIRLKLLALSANSLQDKMLQYCISVENKSFLELAGQWSEDCDSEIDYPREDIEWFLSLGTVFDVDFNSQSLKQINIIQTNRFRLNSLCVCLTLFLSSLRSLQTSLLIGHLEFPTLVTFHLWLLGFHTSFLDITQKDFCYQFLFKKLIIDIKPAVLLTNSYNLLLLFSEVESEFEGGEHDAFNRFVRLGTAHYVYLAIQQGLVIDPLPICYSSLYLQESICPIAGIFLSFSTTFLVSKGLKLLERVTGAEIMFGIHCNWETYAELCHSLTQVMIYSEDEIGRKSAVNIFKRLFSLFCSPLLHYLYKYLIWKVSHSGIIGFLITILKDQIHQSLTNPISVEYQLYFTGPSLHTLLKRIINITTDNASQLPNELDSILSTINLLRYLLLRDSKLTNITHVWYLIPKIQNYCSKLANLATEAIVLFRKDLEISAKRNTSNVRNSSEIQIDESTQLTITKLSLIIDVNNRLAEIINENI